MEESEAIQLVNTLIPFAFAVFIIAVGVVLLHQRFRQRLVQQQLEREELKTQHQTELLRSTIEIQENERKRFARDLHDELGAILAVGRMQAESLDLQYGKQEGNLGSGLKQIEQLFQNGMDASRRISHALLPPELLELGLVKALNNQAEALRSAGLEVAIDGDATHDQISWPSRLALYRISSELMQNTLKHAEATTVDIKLYADGDQLNYQYQDNGQGMDNTKPAHGLGMKNIEARVNALQGSLEFGTGEAGGFGASIQLPIT